jgi:hypothetical protein
MKNKLVSILENNPKLESAFTTFVAFFLIDLGTQIQTITNQPLNTLTWGIIWGLVVAAARTAVKEIWIWYKTPKA